jgi:hypothetical protein
MRTFGRFLRPAYATAGCGCKPSAEAAEHHGVASFMGYQRGEGGQFGIRRPLRFLAYKLGLDDHQVSELARLLDELKTERAQAAVDDRRTLTSFADAMAGETFDQGRADEGALLRKNSSERVGAAVLAALPRIHGLLKAEQRVHFAYLIRTGTLTL